MLRTEPCPYRETNVQNRSKTGVSPEPWVMIKLLVIKGFKVILIRQAVINVGRAALLILICLTGTILAQQPSKNTRMNSNGGLKVIVLEGEDAVNSGGPSENVMMVVEVRDLNDRPIEGAMVNFRLPLMGPSGSFEGGMRTKDAVTNSQGQASAPFTPNAERGKFTIEVKATLGPQTGTVSFMQRNAAESVPGQGSWIGRHKKLVIIGAAVVAGVTIAVVLATRGGSSSTAGNSNSTITISPGIPTVGGPQ